ncbi:Flp pilus assembly protein CpaB [bacterium F16]|nr:Flp pilus assembly protein CpaB [bacterium F16]
MKNYIILGISVLCGLIAFLLAQKYYLQMEQELKLRGQKVNVLIANKHIIAGEKLTSVYDTPGGNVKAEAYPLRLLNKQGKGKFDVLTTKDWEKIRTQDWRMAVSIEKKEPLRWSHFEVSDRKLRRTFSDHVSPKSRALTIPVDSISSVAGLIVPNDNIDIISTFNFPQNRGDASIASASMILLQNVKVLATGKTYKGGRFSERSRGSFSSITLSVSPKEAEMLVFAQQKGKLHMMLRNPQDPYIEEDTQQVNFDELKKNIEKYIKERDKQLKAGKFNR